MARQIVSLYIDDTRIRLMVTAGKRIKRWAELPLDLSLAEVNTAIKEAEIVAKVKQLLKSQKVSSKKVVVGLSGLRCLTRPITLPQLPKAMLHEAVMREARRVLPLPPEQLYISWQTIPSPENEIRVFLVAIPCGTADNLFKILHQAGLKPSTLNLKPLALTRVVKEDTAVIVDVQPNEFDIVVMADGVPQPVRTISFPSESLSLSEKLLIIGEDLGRTIEFYDSNNPEKTLDPAVNVYVSGELTDNADLCDALSNEVGHPVMLLQSSLKYPSDFKEGRYMVNIGLAIMELSGEAGPSVVAMNVLPEPYQPVPISLMRIIAVPTAVVTVCLLVALAFMINQASASIDSMSNRLDTANHILKQNQTQKSELTKDITALEQQIAAMETSRRSFNLVIDKIAEEGDIINVDLEVTKNLLPNTVNLTLVAHSGNLLRVAGVAPSELEVISYGRSLDATGRFSEITITSIGRGSAGTIFALSLKDEIE